MRFSSCLLFALITMLPSAVVYCETVPNPLIQQADQFLVGKDYKHAADLFEKILAGDSTLGDVWFKLGQCYQELGEDQKAMDAYDNAEKNHFPAMNLYYRRSRLFARLHQKDKSFELLNALAGIGFSNAERIKDEKDLAGLQSDARFGELLKKIEDNAHPCDKPDFRNFDFWVGEWDVTSAGSPVGSSSIQRILNSCVIFENFTSFSGYAGKSFNSYDPDKKEWRQYWIDNSGSYVEFVGHFADGQLVYEADSSNPDGTKVHRKMTFVKLTNDRVRQFSVQTADGGKTWTPEYDLLYIKKKD